MKQCERFAEVRGDGFAADGPAIIPKPGALSAREVQAIRERADRLYRMGELAAAAELLIQPGVQ